MKQHRIVAIAIATLLFSLATGLAQGEGKKVKVKGLIATRTGDTLTLKTKTEV